MTETKPEATTPSAPAAPDFTKTPEFIAAVSQAAVEAVAKAMQGMSATLATAPPQAEASSLEMMRQLAMHISDLSYQGTDRRKPVDPKILAEREASMERMGELILASRKLAQAEKPRYRLIAKVYLKEQLIEPAMRRADKSVVATEIIWCNAPNQAMRPVNASAEAIYKEYLGWMGGKQGDLGNHQAQPLWITDKGRVMVSAPGATAQMKQGIDPLIFGDEPAGGNGAIEDDDTFSLLGADAPRTPDIHVLGTVAPPAKQNAGFGERA